MEINNAEQERVLRHRHRNKTLTNYIEGVQQGHLGLRVDLALVHARVPHLGILYVQRPVAGARRTQHLKPLV